MSAPVSAGKPLSIVELVTRVGSDNIGVQNLFAEGTFVACKKREHYDELSFAAYPGLALEMLTGTVKKVGIVLWIDSEILRRAKDAAKRGDPMPADPRCPTTRSVAAVDEGQVLYRCSLEPAHAGEHLFERFPTFAVKGIEPAPDAHLEARDRDGRR